MAELTSIILVMFDYGDYVSELRPSTGLLFVPQMI
jgi:hypothetical protein